MSEIPNSGIAEGERQRIESLWAKAVERITPAPEKSSELALAGGVNLRVHLVEAVKAAYEGAMAVLHGVAAAHAPFDWLAWGETVAAAASAAQSVFAALVQTMRPIDYVTAVVLSVHPEGLTEDALERAVREYLDRPDAVQFSWYLGMSASRVERAREALQAPGWLAGTLSKLEKGRFLKRDGQTLHFQSHNYTIRGED